jgi:hypothetical protein
MKPDLHYNAASEGQGGGGGSKINWAVQLLNTALAAIQALRLDKMKVWF